jgi:hypothetical protein
LNCPHVLLAERLDNLLHFPPFRRQLDAHRAAINERSLMRLAQAL